MFVANYQATIKFSFFPQSHIILQGKKGKTVYVPFLCDIFINIIK